MPESRDAHPFAVRLAVAVLIGCAGAWWHAGGLARVGRAGQPDDAAPARRTPADSRIQGERRPLGPRSRANRAGDAAACAAVVPGKIHRFVAGVDTCLVPMADAEVAAKLNDPFATTVLRRNAFPDSVAAIVAAVNAANAGLQQNSFLVGEGSQIPVSVAPREDSRDLRYVVTWGANANQGDIFLSAAPGGHSTFHQVISWDNAAKKYNFYELRSQVGGGSDSAQVWTWSGESSMARAVTTQGKGCFDCHHNGVVIMKELHFPWNNWQSEAAKVSPLVVPLEVASEDLFRNLNGANTLEPVIRSGDQRYHSQWLRDRVKNDGGTLQLTDVNLMLRHLTTNTTVNFASTGTQSDGAQTSPPNAHIPGIPSDALLWDSALRTLLKLNYTIPDLTLARADFDAYVKLHKFALVQTDGAPPGYRKDGTTYFTGFVPVPPDEDLFLLSQLSANGIVTDKFAASVLMVDFRNPVFSAVRSGLRRYSDQVTTGTVTSGGDKKSSVPDAFAALVRAAAAGQPACDPNHLDQCTAEQQFLYFWDLPDAKWQPEMERRIQAYLDGIGALKPADRLDYLMRLVARRQAQFTQAPTIQNLNEFSLLLPVSDLAN